MADEAVITPDTEDKEVKEGTVQAEIESTKEVTEKKQAAPETVPLAVYLELKDDLKTLKQEIKDSKGSQKSTIEVRGVSELASKYPDVSEEFIKDILNAATTDATKKIEEKYTPIIEKNEQEKRQVQFDLAFDKLFSAALDANPDISKDIDKELVKTLATTPKYINTPVADIIVKMYGTQNSGKPSSESDMRTSADRVEDIVSFDKITEDQKKAVMADPKARQKYFAWLDTQ